MTASIDDNMSRFENGSIKLFITIYEWYSGSITVKTSFHFVVEKVLNEVPSFAIPMVLFVYIMLLEH